LEEVMRLWTGNIKRVLLLVAGLAVIAGIGVLDAAPRGGDRPGMDRPGPWSMEDRQQREQDRFDRMCAFLELNDEQKKQAEELFKSRREEMKQLVQQARTDEQDKKQVREKMRQSFEQHRKDFEAILTEEQAGKLKQWEGRREGRRDRMDGPPERPGAFDLDLTDSQQEQVDKLRDEHREQLREIRDKIEEQKLERDQARELMDSERERFEKEMSGVLSEEQMKKFDDRQRMFRDNVRGRMDGDRSRRPGPGFGPERFERPRPAPGMMPQRFPG